jgi:hypothetical protein
MKAWICLMNAEGLRGFGLAGSRKELEGLKKSDPRKPSPKGSRSAAGTFRAPLPFPRPPVFAKATTGRPVRPGGSFRSLPPKANFQQE